MPSRNLKLDDDITVAPIHSEDIDEPTSNRKFDASHSFFVVESEAGFDETEVLHEIVPQVALEGKLPRARSRSQSLNWFGPNL
jgi:hypothetical protein